MAAKTTSSAASSSTFKQKVRGVVQTQIDSYFKSSLGTEPNIVNYVMGLIQRESSFNPNAVGLAIPDSSPTARDYMTSDPVKKVLLSGSPQQQANVYQGKVALGLMQVMGWNFVRGGSAKAKRCELQSSGIADVTSRLCVNAGDDIRPKILGENNVENAVLAGLVMLHLKWMACRKVGSGWQYSARGGVFQSRLSASVGAYLGTGAKDLRTGITPDQYVASIVGGESYRIANGPGSTVVASNSSRAATKDAPTSNSNDSVASVPGCTVA